MGHDEPVTEQTDLPRGWLPLEQAAETIRTAIDEQLPAEWTTSVRIKYDGGPATLPEAHVECRPPIYTGTTINLARTLVGLWPDHVAREAETMAQQLGHHVRAAVQGP